MKDISFYKNKKVFITGHTGFKGTWLCHILLHSGAEVIGFSLNPPTKPSLFEQTSLKDSMHSIIADIRDRDKLIQSINDSKADIVFHLAAQPLVRFSYREPAITYETNVMGAVNILDAIRLTSTIRSFVNITTDKVYENKEWYWGYRENENLCGFDPYSNSKSCSDLLTYSYRNSFFNNKDSPAISTARSGNVIGGGDYSEDRIIPDCVRAVKAGKEIVVRNPSSTRPYQHIMDTLYGYLSLAEKQFNDKTIEGAYNFGPDDESCITTGELTKLFCSIWGKDAAWKIQADCGPHEATFLKLDCSKSKMILDWRPRWDIKTAVEKVVEFEKTETDIERITSLKDQIKKYFG
ncbi:MAG: CDP-glucose 4,6-dehydratase [Spirochaetaceae bacterium]|nr:CDP-glucose 4,6-dehydratase [Spirochaetaceae bacterium]